MSKIVHMPLLNKIQVMDIEDHLCDLKEKQPIVQKDFLDDLILLNETILFNNERNVKTIFRFSKEFFFVRYL